MAVSDFEHLRRSPIALLRHVDGVNEGIVTRLQKEATSELIDGLRMCTIGRTIIAVGLMGVFEAQLQQHFGWGNVPADLNDALRRVGRDDLVIRLSDIRDAVNVLKHGEGRSYERLLSRKDALTFLVKGREEAFFDEGDVSEISRLIEADSRFVEATVAALADIGAALGVT
ncbi:hypothetical protein [Sphingomonas sp. TWP1-3-1]|uniref:hypothetical protein n=1 Tax=Sphingomonas sp. TWP1-3-1 TaxID=2804612 RepID=UPI003CED0B19